MAWLFVIGVGVGMADDNDGTAALAALASWLMITNLLSTGVVTTLMPSIAENADKTLAFDKIANPFIGILAGIIGATCYNKFKGNEASGLAGIFSAANAVLPSYPVWYRLSCQLSCYSYGRLCSAH